VFELFENLVCEQPGCVAPAAVTGLNPQRCDVLRIEFCPPEFLKVLVTTDPDVFDVMKSLPSVYVEVKLLPVINIFLIRRKV
jgi:hypothetical protein